MNNFFFFFFDNEEEKQRKMREDMCAIIYKTLENTPYHPDYNRQDRILERLRKDVTGWHTHSRNGSVKHKWFKDYYPYKNHKSGASRDQWDTWRLIWQFKNEKDEDQRKYQLSLQRAVQMVETTLLETFGDDVKNLCLVCLTASTKEKNDRRFKAFSEKVCKDLNMSNGFTHIRIVKDSSAKHTGGDGMTDKEFDGDFFKGKNIVLFDDVRSTGAGLVREKERLEQMGANIICAITLGQTVLE